MDFSTRGTQSFFGGGGKGATLKGAPALIPDRRVRVLVAVVVQVEGGVVVCPELNVSGSRGEARQEGVVPVVVQHRHALVHQRTVRTGHR